MECFCKAASGAGKASKQAAKDMKGVLAGFDDLNVLAAQAADSVGSAAGGVGDLGDVGDVSGGGIEMPDIPSVEYGDQIAAFQTLGEAFNALLDEILNGIPHLKEGLLGFAEGLNGFSANLYEMFTFPGVTEKVEDIGRELADALNQMVLAIDWNLLGAAIGAGLNLALLQMVAFIYTFDWIALGKKLAELINGLVETIDWYAFGQLLWAKFKIALETLAGFLINLDMKELALAASNIAKGFYDSVAETLQKIDWAELGRQMVRFIVNVDWAGIMRSYSGAIGSLAGAIAAFIGGAISEAFTGIYDYFADKVEACGGNIVAGILKSIIDAIVDIGRWIVENIFQPFIDGFKKVFGIHSPSTVMEEMGGYIIEGLLNGIGNIIGNVVTLFQELWETIKETARNAWEGICDAFSTAGDWFSEHVIEPVKAFFSGLWDNITQLASDAWEGIQNAWSEAGDWFNQNIIEPVAQFFSELWDKITELAGEAWEGIVSVWQTASEWFNTNIIQPVQTFFTDLWAGVQKAAQDAWAGISNVWSVVSGWFHANIIQPVSGFFSGLWDGISKAAGDAWKSITDVFGKAASWFKRTIIDPVTGGFQGFFNGLIGFAEGFVNFFIRGINKLIGALNGLSFSAPDWVPLIGGKRFGLNIPTASELRLPRLANGAVIPPNSQFAAILGDQRSGVNIESPLSTIEQALRNVLASNGGLGGDVTVDFTINLDSREIYRGQKRVKRQLGTNLVGGLA